MVDIVPRLQGTGINVYSLHPGVIATELGRHIEKQLGVFGKLLVVIYPFIKVNTDL